ncbi:hypothetical protein D5086_024069 [Populus alba]|uniref:Uncharacterized protein n=1 Tax=Populus alba TaxID=43335 RepID=A0ACC4B580_POPAL
MVFSLTHLLVKSNTSPKVCTDVRPAADEELSSPYIEEFRTGIVVQCTKSSSFFMGSILFILTLTNAILFSASCALDAEMLKYVAEAYPKGICSVYCVDGKDVEGPGSNFELVVAPDDCAISIANIIRHHEAEYLESLEASYSNLPDTTFKIHGSYFRAFEYCDKVFVLFRSAEKLPVTRTQFPWHNTLQFSLTRDIQKELGIDK